MGNRPNGSLITLALAMSLLSGNLVAQTANSFDINRYSTFGAGFFETYYVQKTQLLREALIGGLVTEETNLLVTKTEEGNLALIRDQMAFHHIAQGSINGKDWMATF
ncbi:uncharacterized protein METZ01_LOCUS495965 [marine metagenome]|uniref:Uncharacterized protein n=1 Tax=marine metagenome TaxID=408172 RepID=A0A383DFE1_9ZZZZ